MTRTRWISLTTGIWVALLFVTTAFRALADCASFGLPFTDLGSTSFCAAITEAYYTGLTHGTSATTFSPTAPVNREQAAIFATRTLDAALARGSRRAALGQWWTTHPGPAGISVIPFHGLTLGVPQSDGADIWVPVVFGDSYPPAARVQSVMAPSDSVVRVRASDGKVLETWTSAPSPEAVLVAMGRIFVTGRTTPGALYMIDPSQPPGDVTVVASNLGGLPQSIAFDGSRIWTANDGGSVSIITPGSSLPWAVETVTSGFTKPFGILFDGQRIWVTDFQDNSLKQLDSAGTVVGTVPVGKGPLRPIYDGKNIWVPNGVDNSLSVVQASDGRVLKTITGNGLSQPLQAAFDGRRVLVNNSLITRPWSLFDAASLAPIGEVSSQITSFGWGVGVCSDGINFWLTSALPGSLARF